MKERAVQFEDFDEAKRLKVAIDRLRAMGKQLGKLEEKKRIAVENEDYDFAKSLKIEIEKLKRQAIDGPIDGRYSQLERNMV